MAGTGTVESHIPHGTDRFSWAGFTIVGAVASVPTKPVPGLNLSASQTWLAGSIRVAGAITGALFLSYPTVSEVFPTEVRVMALFCAVSTGIGGITGPLIFGRERSAPAPVGPGMPDLGGAGLREHGWRSGRAEASRRPAPTAPADGGRMGGCAA